MQLRNPFGNRSMTGRNELGEFAKAWLGTALAFAVPAVAQEPYSNPPLTDEPEDGFGGGEATATPAPKATATATATATAEPTATPRSGPPKAQLANTGSEPLQVALIGLTLLGFGLALRFRVALADARRPV